MKRLMIFLLLPLIVLALLSGCSEELNPPQAQEQPIEAEQPEQSNQGEKMGEAKAEEPPVAENKTMNIKIFLTDDEAMELKELEREIEVREEGPSIYEAAFQALATEIPTYYSPWSEWKLLNVQFAEGLLTLDLSGSAEQGGSSIERLMILSLLQTMFQFSEVQEVQLLVNGEKTETLYGHIDIEQPFSRDEAADL